MVAADKIEQAKDCFDTIRTSGRNNFQNFDYLETKDIFPLVRKVCRKFNLRTNIKPDISLNCFILTITDTDDNSFEQFFVPYAQISANDVGKYMQDFGRCQTYAMRYLYIQAFEIAVPDEIDNKDQRKQQQKPTVKQKKVLKKQPKKVVPTEVQKEEKKEVTGESVNEILDTAYERVTLDAGKEFTVASALWILKNLCNDDDELQACKDALEMYTADKVKGL